jgi:RNA polymerase-binding transcription factor DksA
MGPAWAPLAQEMTVDDEHPLSPAEAEAVAAVIAADRRRTTDRIDALEREHAAIVASTEGSPPDDEHDPEGATIGFERAQVGALLAHARAHLSDLERARHALESGTYGTCARCGGAIPLERLLARPTATTCAACPAG